MAELDKQSLSELKAQGYNVPEIAPEDLEPRADGTMSPEYLRVNISLYATLDPENMPDDYVQRCSEFNGDGEQAKALMVAMRADANGPRAAEFSEFIRLHIDVAMAPWD